MTRFRTRSIRSCGAVVAVGLLSACGSISADESVKQGVPVSWTQSTTSIQAEPAAGTLAESMPPTPELAVVPGSASQAGDASLEPPVFSDRFYGDTDAQVADVWSYLRSEGLLESLDATTTTTVVVAPEELITPSPVPAPTESAPAAPSPTPRPAPAPQYRVNCPSGEVITIDYQPTNAQMRELCGMTPAPTGTVPIIATHRITCPDGTQHTFDRRLSDAEIDEVCGTNNAAPTTPPPTTTPPTTVPSVRILRVTMTYQGGDWFSQGVFADDTSCPAVADISYTVQFDNGDSTTGRVSVPINNNPSVALPYATSMTIRYNGPGGADGCQKGLVY